MLVSVGLLFMVGCNNIPYNATLYDDVNDCIKESFAKESLIRNVYYNDSGYDEVIIIEDETVPENRTFIVNTQDAYNEIFVADIEFFDVDFKTQMLIVYTFKAINHRKINIAGIKLQDSSLNIEYKSPYKHGIGDTSVPYQRWIVVKLDKLDITSVITSADLG